MHVFLWKIHIIAVFQYLDTQRTLTFALMLGCMLTSFLAVFMLKVFCEQNDASPDAEDIVVNHEDFMEVHYLLSHEHSLGIFCKARVLHVKITCAGTSRVDPFIIWNGVVTLSEAARSVWRPKNLQKFHFHIHGERINNEWLGLMLYSGSKSVMMASTIVKSHQWVA